LPKSPHIWRYDRGLKMNDFRVDFYAESFSLIYVYVSKNVSKKITWENEEFLIWDLATTVIFHGWKLLKYKGSKVYK
jgi:hypothetical protein